MLNAIVQSQVHFHITTEEERALDRCSQV